MASPRLGRCCRLSVIFLFLALVVLSTDSKHRRYVFVAASPIRHGGRGSDAAASSISTRAPLLALLGDVEPRGGVALGNSSATVDHHQFHEFRAHRGGIHVAGAALFPVVRRQQAETKGFGSSPLPIPEQFVNAVVACVRARGGGGATTTEAHACDDLRARRYFLRRQGGDGGPSSIHDPAGFAVLSYALSVDRNRSHVNVTVNASTASGALRRAYAVLSIHAGSSSSSSFSPVAAPPQAMAIVMRSPRDPPVRAAGFSIVKTFRDPKQVRQLLEAIIPNSGSTAAGGGPDVMVSLFAEPAFASTAVARLHLTSATPPGALALTLTNASFGATFAVTVVGGGSGAGSNNNRHLWDRVVAWTVTRAAVGANTPPLVAAVYDGAGAPVGSAVIERPGPRGVVFDNIFGGGTGRRLTVVEAAAPPPAVSESAPKRNQTTSSTFWRPSRPTTAPPVETARLHLAAEYHEFYREHFGELVLANVQDEIVDTLSEARNTDITYKIALAPRALSEHARPKFDADDSAANSDDNSGDEISAYVKFSMPFVAHSGGGGLRSVDLSVMTSAKSVNLQLLVLDGRHNVIFSADDHAVLAAATGRAVHSDTADELGPSRMWPAALQAPPDGWPGDALRVLVRFDLLADQQRKQEEEASHAAHTHAQTAAGPAGSRSASLSSSSLRNNKAGLSPEDVAADGLLAALHRRGAWLADVVLAPSALAPTSAHKQRRATSSSSSLPRSDRSARDGFRSSRGGDGNDDGGGGHVLRLARSVAAGEVIASFPSRQAVLRAADVLRIAPALRRLTQSDEYYRRIALQHRLSSIEPHASALQIAVGLLLRVPFGEVRTAGEEKRTDTAAAVYGYVNTTMIPAMRQRLPALWTAADRAALFQLAGSAEPDGSHTMSAAGAEVENVRALWNAEYDLLVEYTSLVRTREEYIDARAAVSSLLRVVGRREHQPSAGAPEAAHHQSADPGDADLREFGLVFVLHGVTHVDRDPNTEERLGTLTTDDGQSSSDHGGSENVLLVARQALAAGARVTVDLSGAGRLSTPEIFARYGFVAARDDTLATHIAGLQIRATDAGLRMLVRQLGNLESPQPARGSGNNSDTEAKTDNDDHDPFSSLKTLQATLRALRTRLRRVEASLTENHALREPDDDDDLHVTSTVAQRRRGQADATRRLLILETEALRTLVRRAEDRIFEVQEEERHNADGGSDL